MSVLFSEGAELAVLNVDLYDKLGGKDAALIVQTIYYRCEKSRRVATYKGEKWVRITVDEFARVLHRSEKTVRTVLKRLTTEGFILSRCLSSRKSDRAKFYRLNYDLIQFGERDPCGKIYRPHAVKITGWKRQNLPIPVKSGCKSEDTKMKAADILEQMKKGKPVDKKKPLNGAELGVLWLETYAEVFDLTRVQAVVPDRRKAMLKRVQNTTHFNMTRFLPWIMRNWHEFTEKVAREHGYKKRPERPSIEYLLKNLDKAEEMYRGRNKTKKQGGGGNLTKHKIGE